MGKTEDLLKILREELKSGRYKAGSKFPSERKLMMRFNAARTTVNKITAQLAGEGLIRRGVQGSGTRVVESSPFPKGELAYLGTLADSYYARLVNGIQQTAFLKNYALSVFSPGPEMIYHGLEKIRHSRYLGLLVSNIGIIPGIFPIPVVYLDNGYEVSEQVRVSVTCTNYRGAYELAQAVIGHGHREILVFTSFMDSEFSRGNRLRGFMDALVGSRIPKAEKRLFRETLKDVASVKFLLQKALKDFPGTTVIMTDSDSIAMKLFQVLRDMDMEKKITITGFGNLSHSGGLMQIPGVEQHPEEIGAQGVNELIRMIEEPGYVSPGLIEIETELVNLQNIPVISGSSRQKRKGKA